MRSSIEATPALAFEQVTRRYDGISAVDALSLSLARGSFVALTGASGSGKSSLLRLANRLDMPDEGRVLLDARDIAAMDPVQLRRRVGYVFQNIGLFPHMTVAENIGIGPRVAGEPPVDVAAALAEVELPGHYAERLPNQLSGGEQQRVGIARALAGKARLMLMDEPFGALDPMTREQLGLTIRRLHEARGLTTVMVTHDMTEALMLADRIVIMAKGGIIADATPREMLRNQAGSAAATLVAAARARADRLAELAR
jgi:osmoprotectant transport system ATP-binding protein